MKRTAHKWYFNEFCQVYQNGRFGYFDEVYQIITNECQFDANSKILEIGAGSGIATNEIYEKWHPDLTVIEPGNQFVKLLRESSYSDKIKIVNSTFENFDSDEKFDGVISATAFHWIDKDVKYKKTFNLLKSNGFLVLYWNNYSVFDCEINKEIEHIYKHYNCEFECNYLKQLQKIENRRKEIVDACEFVLIKHNAMEQVLSITSRDFISLLNTFINHNNTKRQINKDIDNLLNSHDGRINLRILVNLEIAKKI